MNHITTNYCVSNRNICVQIFILCTILFLMSLMQPSIAQSESIEFEFQSKYPELVFEYMVYAEPYYAVLLRGKYQRTIQFYLRDGDDWTLHHQKIVDMPDNQEFISCQANDSLLVIRFSLKDIQYGLQVIDINTDDGSYDYIVTPQKEFEVNGEIYPYSLCIFAIHIKERTVVYLTEQMFVRISYDESLNQVEYKEFVIPSDYFITDFDFLGENLLYVSDPQAEENDPRLRGVGIARFNSSNELVFDRNLRFFKTENIDGPRIFRKPEAIRTLGATSFIVRETGEISYLTSPRPTHGTGYEMLIVDWSDEDNPRLVQTIGKPDVTWEFISNATFGYDANESMLALRILNTSKAVLNIYEPIGGRWEKSSSIDLSFPYPQRLSLGGNTVIIQETSEASIYDLSDPSTPRAIDPPVDETERFDDLNFYNDIFYFMDIHGALTAARFDESGNINIVDQRPIPDGWLLSDVDYGLCCLRKDKEIKILSLNETGGFGEEIALPEYPTDNSIRYVWPMWNDSYFIIVYTQYTTDMHLYISPKDDVIQIYPRDGKHIGSMLSKFSHSSRYFAPVIFIEDFLVTTEKITGDIWQYKLWIYPLDSDNPDENLIEYEIPLNPNRKNLRRSQVARSVSYNPEMKYLAYTCLHQSGIIDFSDPHNPQHLDYFLPASKSVHWRNSELILIDNDAIRSYRIEDDKAVLIGSMDDIIINSTRVKPRFINDNMYFSRGYLGMEIYKITIDKTNVEDWFLYQ